jgi:transposase-like protein
MLIHERDILRQQQIARDTKRGANLSLTCPTCKRENALTRAQAARGYQCNSCADADDPDGAGSYYG